MNGVIYLMYHADSMEYAGWWVVSPEVSQMCRRGVSHICCAWLLISG